MTDRSWLAQLPWRRPFLMIDGLVDCVRGERIVTRKSVTFDDPFIGTAGGGVGRFPAMLLLEGMGQSAALLFRLSYPDQADRALPLLGFLEAKLVDSAGPGAAIEFDVRSIKMTRTGGVFAGRATAGADLLAEAELAFKAEPVDGGSDA